MKTIHITTLALAALLMAFTPLKHPVLTKENTHVKAGSSIQWKQVELDLGSIEQNKPVTMSFEFINTGDAAVVITAVQAGCGCTVTNYSKEPVAPGQSSKISATYNAATKGVFKKTVTVTTSAEETPRVLSFKGTVI